MRIDIPFFTVSSKMSINFSPKNVQQSCFLFQKSSPSAVHSRVNPGVTGELNQFQKTSPFAFLQNRTVFVSRILASKNGPSSRRVQPDKKWLKAKDSIKQTSLLSTETLTISEQFTLKDDMKLRENQAIGLVVAAQANFMRVIVERAGDEEFEEETSTIENSSEQFVSNGSVGALHENLESGNNNLDSSRGTEAAKDTSKQRLEVVSAENAQVAYGSNVQTSTEVKESCGEITDYPDSGPHVDSGHVGICRMLSAVQIDRGNSNIQEAGNLNPVTTIQDRDVMDAKPKDYRRENDNDDNLETSALVQRNRQYGTSENSKENQDFGTSPKESLRTKTGTELLCVVRALLKKIKRRVLVGDKVLVGGIDWTDKRGMIEDAFERKSELMDPPVANVDHLLVLFSMDQPKLELSILTRFLVEAESTEIPFTLVLNKSDLVQEEVMHTWEERLKSWGYQPLFCSADSNVGVTALVDVLENRTSVVVGPSGVGKSSLINALRRGLEICVTSDMDPFSWQVGDGSKWFEDQRVGEISVRSGRGKHTTRNVALLPLPTGGFLADTPGFNQPSLVKVTKSSLAWMFPEIKQMMNASEFGRCAFKDCLHIGEPGCAVKGDWERYPYYLQLLDEIKIREEIQIRLIGTKRESDVRYKVGEMGVKQAEPRLELKKHRRQSRKRVNQSILDEVMEELEDTED
eukprot:Gb_14300 [translate_table: standard]